jgi:hypothetical protein
MFARRERSGAYSRHAVEIGALLPHARNQTLRRALQQFSSRLNSLISRVWRRVWFQARLYSSLPRHGHAGDIRRDFWRNARFE